MICLDTYRKCSEGDRVSVASGGVAYREKHVHWNRCLVKLTLYNFFVIAGKLWFCLFADRNHFIILFYFLSYLILSYLILFYFILFYFIFGGEIGFLFRLCWETTGIHHCVMLRHTARWFNLPQWAQSKAIYLYRYNKKKRTKKCPCDKNSGFTLLPSLQIIVHYTMCLFIF